MCKGYSDQLYSVSFSHFSASLLRFLLVPVPPTSLITSCDALRSQLFCLLCERQAHTSNSRSSSPVWRGAGTAKAQPERWALSSLLITSHHSQSTCIHSSNAALCDLAEGQLSYLSYSGQLSCPPCDCNARQRRSADVTPLPHQALMPSLASHAQSEDIRPGKTGYCRRGVRAGHVAPRQGPWKGALLH